MKSRQNHDEHRKMMWQRSMVMHPEVEHLEQAFAEEEVTSRNGVKYVKYHKIYYKHKPA